MKRTEFYREMFKIAFTRNFMHMSNKKIKPYLKIVPKAIECTNTKCDDLRPENRNGCAFNDNPTGCWGFQPK